MPADTSWMDPGNGSSRHIPEASDQGPGADDARRPIGEIFVELGFVSRAELDSALDVQRTTGGRIGEILVDQGSLTRIDLASALAEHWVPHPHADEVESIEDVPDDAARSPTELTAPQPEPEAQAKPRRSRLRRSAARGDALEEQVGRLSETLAVLGRESYLRAEHDRVVAERVRELTLRIDNVEGRFDEIERLEARLGAVSELAADLRGELMALAQREPAQDPGERLLELSLRIEQGATETRDRIAALAAELRTEVATASAAIDARLRAQLDEAAALQRRVGSVEETATSALAGSAETTAELHVEIGSLAGRLDELLGLRHADAQVARAANERLAARLEGLIARQADEAAAALAVALDARDDPDALARVEEGLERLTTEVAELTRRLERHDAVADETAIAIERAVLEELTALGKRLTARSSKHGKPSKRLRRSIDALALVIDVAEARLAEQGPASEPAA